MTNHREEQRAGAEARLPNATADTSVGGKDATLRGGTQTAQSPAHQNTAPPGAQQEAARLVPDGSRITHRWAGAYSERLEYLLDGRLLTMEEVKGMLHYAITAKERIRAALEGRK